MDPWTPPPDDQEQAPDALPFYGALMQAGVAPDPAPPYTPPTVEEPVDQAAIDASLAQYGWTPEARTWLEASVPVNWASVPHNPGDPPGYLGGSYDAGDAVSGWPATGRVIVNDVLRSDPALPGTIEHESHHAYDQAGPLGSYSPNNPALGPDADLSNIAFRQQIERLAAEPSPRYAVGAEAARALLQQYGLPPPAAIADPTHFDHNLIQRLGFDYSELPPDYAQQHFGYATYAPAPIAAALRAQSFLPQLGGRRSLGAP